MSFSVSYLKGKSDHTRDREVGGGGGGGERACYLKGRIFFWFPHRINHTEFFGIPPLLTTLVFRRKVKYGQNDEMVNV